MDDVSVWGELDINTYLVETHSADSDNVDSDGSPSLHNACSHGMLHVVEFLEEQCGANVHSVDMETTRHDHESTDKVPAQQPSTKSPTIGTKAPVKALAKMATKIPTQIARQGDCRAPTEK
jgi:hypothetical protein